MELAVVVHDLRRSNFQPRDRIEAHFRGNGIASVVIQWVFANILMAFLHRPA